MIDKYRLREFFATRQRWLEMEVVIVSSQQNDPQTPPNLLSFHLQASSKRPKEVLPLSIESAKALKRIEVPSFRHRLPSDLGSLLSNHLLELHKIYLKPGETLVEDAAQRYLDLVAWGEPNSAKVLAEAEKISIRTMHSRLLNARKKGILDSPGSGFRS
jgi:hypothetical protein